MSTTLDHELDEDAFATMIGRLNRLSVDKHHDAYVDVDWDNPDWTIDPADFRLALVDVDPVSATDWYRSQPADVQAKLGLYRYAACMKIGWHFENLLQRGLLAFAMRTPNGAVEFRYLHHEVIEESQHTLMFQEYVNRSGLPVRGMARTWRFLAELATTRLAKLDPPFFFVLVLGGEDPIDHFQRAMLQEGIEHPLTERIMRIHVTEEARHLSFARHYLKREVPKLGRVRRARMAIGAPIVLGIMARMMLMPPSDLRRECGLPKSAVRQAFWSREGRKLLRDSVAKTRNLWIELGLVGPMSKRLWKLLGIWEERKQIAP